MTAHVEGEARAFVPLEDAEVDPGLVAHVSRQCRRRIKKRRPNWIVRVSLTRVENALGQRGILVTAHGRKP